MKILEEKKKKIQARLYGRAPLFDDSEKGNMLLSFDSVIVAWLLEGKDI